MAVVPQVADIQAAVAQVAVLTQEVVVQVAVVEEHADKNYNDKINKVTRMSHLIYFMRVCACVISVLQAYCLGQAVRLIALCLEYRALIPNHTRLCLFVMLLWQSW